MELLIKHGAAVDADGQNPILNAAVTTGNDEYVRYLVEEKKAKRDSCDALGYSPLSVAIKSNQLPTVELLLEYGAPIESCLRTVMYG